MCGEGYITTDAHGVIISGYHHLDRSSIVDIDRELVAQGRTTAMVSHLDGEQVRVVRSIQMSSQSIAGSTFDISVSESPLISEVMMYSVVDIGNQDEVVVGATDVADDRVARNLNGRVHVNNDGSIN